MLAHESVDSTARETAEYYEFTSGPLAARVNRAANAWRVDYIGDDRVLTSSAYHGMAHAHNRNTCRDYSMDSLMLDVGECVYGLGERFTALVKNGQTVDMWQGDGGTSSDMAYKNVPFYMTNRGYGIFVDSPSDVSFEVASEKVERVQFSCEGERIAYCVIYGPTPQAGAGALYLADRPACAAAGMELRAVAVDQFHHRLRRGHRHFVHTGNGRARHTVARVFTSTASG